MHARKHSFPFFLVMPGFDTAAFYRWTPDIGKLLVLVPTQRLTCK
jgi:hypothetical protein